MDNDLLATQIRSAYFNDPQFQAHYQADPEDAMAVLNKVIADTTRSNTVISPRAVNAAAGCNVTLYQQINGYYCGPANVLMAISAWNGQGSVSGSTVSAKQQTLGTTMGTNSTDGTLVYKVRNCLNSYVPSSPSYTYVLGASSDGTISLEYLFFLAYVYGSLEANRPPILHAATRFINYYEEYRTGHYITISYLDMDTGEVIVKDSNSNNTFYGTHEITAREAYESITSVGGRYLIYAS